MERHGSEAISSSARAYSGRRAAAGSSRLRLRLRRCRRFDSRGWARREPASSSASPTGSKIADAMTVDNLSPGQIPAGYTYLGQFLDHDLTFDKSALMEGVDISPATLLQSRSPSLDLDSLYGDGPQDPASAKFYEADGIHLKQGTAQGGPQGSDLPRKTSARSARRSSPIRETTRTLRSRRPTPRSSGSTTASSTRCPPRCRRRSDSRKRGRSSRSTTSGW